MTEHYADPPWRITLDLQDGELLVLNASSGIVARIDPDMNFCRASREHIARLMAASPKLLNLCERSLFALDEEDFPSLRDDLRAAIAAVVEATP
jgi:hypothetical protein